MHETPPPLVWDDKGPRSTLYGDIYFSTEDGLAESRAVFLQGCGLPGAWAGRRRYVVGELGFGSGLNICALLDLWRRERPASALLHIFTIEAHLMSREEASRALAAFPEVAEVAAPLLERWPARRRGMHRIEIPEFSAILDVAVMEAVDALAGWSGAADAWFLDGFSPALNPAMWREEVLSLVARRSAPGAVAATFTVAGDVRRRLQDGGFVVEKKPGFGRKRERLEARLPGVPQDQALPAKVLIVGGGIAAASVKRAFEVLGCVTRVIVDSQTRAASGNAAALVTPALDAGGGARAAFYADAFSRAVRLYSESPQAMIAQGAYQLEADARDGARFAKIAAQELFEAGSVAPVSDAAVGEALCEPPLQGGLLLQDGLVVEPAVILERWLGSTLEGRVESLTASEGGVVVRLEDGRVEQADCVVLACALDAARLAGVTVAPVRGQASLARGVNTRACAFGAYAIPTRDGVLFGATHDRGDSAVDLREEDHRRNLASLAKGRPNLAAGLADQPLEGRASTRAATPDRMPVAGRLRGGVYVLAGLGSRGFCTAPLLAEHVAALAVGAPSPLLAGLTRLVDPARQAQP